VTSVSSLLDCGVDLLSSVFEKERLLWSFPNKKCAERDYPFVADED